MTRYDLELFPKPQAIRTCSVTFDYASYDSVATWLNDAMRRVDQRLEVICTLGQAEGSSAANPKFAVNIAAVAFASSQDEARGCYAALLQPPVNIKAIGDVFDAPSTMIELFQAIDVEFPDNKHMSGDSCWSNAQLGDLMMAMKPLVPKAPAAPSGISFMALGDALVPRSDAAAYSVGGRPYVGAYAFSEEPKEEQMNRDWVRAAICAADSRKIGHYVGEADLSVVPQRAEQCFSPTAWKRLKSLKRNYDPANFLPGTVMSPPCWTLTVLVATSSTSRSVPVMLSRSIAGKRYSRCRPCQHKTTGKGATVPRRQAIGSPV